MKNEMYDHCRETVVHVPVTVQPSAMILQIPHKGTVVKIPHKGTVVKIRVYQSVSIQSSEQESLSP